MLRRLFSLILLCCFMVLPLLQAAELTEGMSQAEVEALLGKPSSVLHRGNRTLLLYPQKGRVELEEGRAVVFSNVHASPEAASAATAPAPASPAPAATPKPAEGGPSRTTPPDKAPGKNVVDELTRKQASVSDTIEKLSDTPRGISIEQPPRAIGRWPALLIECVVRILVTVVVLKLAFYWAEVHADWGQMWLPALADSLARTAIAAAALQFWHSTQLLHIDDFVSYLVLLFTLMRTTHACTLPRAVAVTLAAKLASLIVWVLLSVALLNLLA